jgi:biofilm PGA synthesis N-glycosyltransferase PgaC
MKWIFWSSVALIAYTYAGYMGWLWLRSLWRARLVRRAHYSPSVSIMMVVRNEEQVLEQKLQNLLALDYPTENVQLIIVSDGSTDGSEAVLRTHAENPRITGVLNQLPRGKASGLNDAVQLAQGDIVVFTDARQKIELDAVRLLLENFADPEVGCVSGELMLGDPASGETTAGMGLYWKIEKKVRELESASGSVVGATGALYAVRRELLVRVPAETILDDVYIPMHVARQGSRVVFDPRARAWDLPGQGREREFSRKVRTLSGNYQLLQLAPWLLGRENPLRFEFISHKLLRLVAAFALLGVLVSSMFLHGAIYRDTLILQIGFYSLSLLGLLQIRLGPLTRITDAAFTFVALNLAALFASANFITGRRSVWEPVRPISMATRSGQEVK